MTEPNVLSALRTKRAELEGEFRQIELRADLLRANRDTIDRAILSFERAIYIADNRRHSIFPFKHGQFSRSEQSLLRQSGQWISVQELATRVAAEHDLNVEAPDAMRGLIAKIRPALGCELGECWRQYD